MPQIPALAVALLLAASNGLPAELNALMPALREDAARRSGTAEPQLQLVSVDEVTWSDGALGCPEPGLTYTMALVPGWRVVLAPPAGGTHQHYHTDRRGHWLWCPAARSSVPPGSAQRM